MVITEVMSEMDVEMCEEYADILQIGARTMHAFKLLQAVGKDAQAGAGCSSADSTRRSANGC